MSGLSGSGNRMAWSQSDGTYDQIFTWAVGDSSPMQLTFEACDHSEPQVSGDRLAWLAWHVEFWSPRGQPVLSSEVFTCRLGDAAPTSLTAGLHGERPRVAGDRVVWTQVVDGCSQVFTWEAGDAATTQLTPSDGLNRDYPEVDGDRVVWQLDDFTYPIENELFTQVVGVDVGPERLASGSRNNYGAQVSGDRIVWFQGSAEESSYEVYTCEVGDAAPTLLTGGDASGYNPRVSGDRVVWEGYDRYVDGPDLQVFTQKVGVDPAPVRLTLDAQDHRWPVVLGDAVAWLKVDESGRHQVFTQRIGVDPEPIQLTVDANVAQTAPLVSQGGVFWRDLATPGVFAAAPISSNATELLRFVQASAASGHLMGAGSGKAAATKLAVFVERLRSAEAHLSRGRYHQALGRLQTAYKACDGLNEPGDSSKARRDARWRPERRSLSTDSRVYLVARALHKVPTRQRQGTRAD